MVTVFASCIFWEKKKSYGLVSVLPLVLFEKKIPNRKKILKKIKRCHIITVWVTDGITAITEQFFFFSFDLSHTRLITLFLSEIRELSFTLVLLFKLLPCSHFAASQPSRSLACQRATWPKVQIKIFKKKKVQIKWR